MSMFKRSLLAAARASHELTLRQPRKTAVEFYFTGKKPKNTPTPKPNRALRRIKGR